MKPLIICAAVTGGAPAKAKTPHHPTTPREVVDSAVACWRAGASVIHYHARLEDGSTTMDVDAYRDIADRIRATGCDAILNLSAGDNGGRANHEQRLDGRRRGDRLARRGFLQYRQQDLRQFTHLSARHVRADAT